MEENAPKGWWSRNWKWVVPVGCGTLVLGAIGVVMGMVLLFANVFKSSDAYDGAVQRARSDARVVEALGTPIEEGFLPSGNINVSGSSGNANLKISISGPKGEAVIYVKATKSGGEWKYSVLDVVLGTSGERITLLEPERGDP